ncbi:MAG: ATP-dependent DNA helicase [Mycobacteriales bacterium]
MFTRADLLQGICEHLPVGSQVASADLERLADRILADAERVVPLVTRTAHGPAYTTTELLLTEQRAVRLAATPTRVPTLDGERLAGVLQTLELSREQARAVRWLLASPHLVDVVVGPAGAGKTAALQAVYSTWNQAGVPVHGAALAAVAARRLEQATGIPSDSLHRLLADLDRVNPDTGSPVGLARGAVVVIDEASMVGTRQLARLFDHVAAAAGKCLLVGDPAQLAEIEAGGLFATLARTPNTVELTGNQRQQHAWERKALGQLRAGRLDPAVNAYLAHGRVHPSATREQATKQITRAYLDHRQHLDDPYAVVMLATTRADTSRLNELARAALTETGALGPDHLTAGANLELATGDLVVVTRNDRRRGLLNGTRAHISVIDPDRRTVQLRTDDARDVQVGADWTASHLQHAYALTCHKAQGLTVDIALLYGSASLCQQAGYVALSRGRQANHIYTSLGPAHQELAGEIDQPPRYRRLSSDTADPEQVLAALRDQLGLNRAQQLASEHPHYALDPLTHRASRHHGLGLSR